MDVRPFQRLRYILGMSMAIAVALFSAASFGTAPGAAFLGLVMAGAFAAFLYFVHHRNDTPS